MVHLGHRHVQAVGDEAVALLRHTADLLHHPAGDGVGVALPLYLEQVKEVGQIGGAGDEVAVVLLLLELLDDLVVLVPDLAHQLLHDILQGDQALGAAVLVHHNDHVGFLPLEDAQQLGDLGVAGGIEHGAQHLLHAGQAAVAGRVEILLMDDADDIVDVLVVHRQAGIPVLSEDLGDLLHGVGVLHRHDVHPGGEDLLHLQVVELDGRPDKAALMLVQAALALRLVHQSDQLLLGNAAVRRFAEHLGQQPLPLGKQEVQRGKDRTEHPQQRGGKHGKPLGGLLGQALGGDLAEDQDHHGQHNGGHGRSSHLINQVDKEYRADGGGHVVDDVIADKQGGEQLVVVLRQSQGTGRPLVASVCPALEPHPVQGGKGGLRGREIA